MENTSPESDKKQIIDRLPSAGSRESGAFPIMQSLIKDLKYIIFTYFATNDVLVETDKNCYYKAKNSIILKRIFPGSSIDYIIHVYLLLFEKHQQSPGFINNIIKYFHIYPGVLVDGKLYPGIPGIDSHTRRFAYSHLRRLFSNYSLVSKYCNPGIDGLVYNVSIPRYDACETILKFNIVHNRKKYTFTVILSISHVALRSIAITYENESCELVV